MVTRAEEYVVTRRCTPVVRHTFGLCYLGFDFFFFRISILNLLELASLTFVSHEVFLDISDGLFGLCTSQCVRCLQPLAIQGLDQSLG